jgi:hypothetical protein
MSRNWKSKVKGLARFVPSEAILWVVGAPFPWVLTSSLTYFLFLERHQLYWIWVHINDFTSITSLKIIKYSHILRH